MRCIFELKNNFLRMDIVNSSIIGGIVSIVFTFSNDVLEIINNMNQKINIEISKNGNKELIRKISNVKITNNIEMFIVVFIIVFICTLMVLFIEKMLNSVKNIPTIYLNEKEIKIIEDILEGD
ncbi:hypothetical protein FYJ83_13930 [Tissierella sp. DSM 105185]|uniref:Uncharacterized protein n=2 Tax=Tissierella pigra TaxID=2607614 RepID=A0A6N7Y1D8_9FIRM|nr:hypothetical protein [Tissierella pigra]